MKQIVLGANDPGMLVMAYKDDLLHINEAIYESVNAIVAALGPNVYLGDPQITYPTGMASTPGGFLVYKGEICQFDAQNLVITAGDVLAWTPLISWRNCDPIQFYDAVARNVHLIKKVTLVDVTQGGSPADQVLLSDMVSFQDAIAADGEWVYFASMLSSWEAVGGNYAPAYKLWANGKVELKGYADSSFGATNDKLFQLPEAACPNRNIALKAEYVEAVGSVAAMTSGQGRSYLFIDTSGYIYADRAVSGAPILSLEGISFYIE